MIYTISSGGISVQFCVLFVSVLRSTTNIFSQKRNFWGLLCPTWRLLLSCPALHNAIRIRFNTGHNGPVLTPPPHLKRHLLDFFQVFSGLGFFLSGGYLPGGVHPSNELGAEPSREF